MLRIVKVREKIDALRSKHLTDLEIDAKRVLRGIAQLAFYDPRQLFTADGKLKSIADLDETCAMAIKGIDVEVVVNSRKVQPIVSAKDAAKDAEKSADKDAAKKDDSKKAKPADDAETAEPTHEEIREVRTVTKKIRLADRGENLERLGRHLKLFTDRIEFEDTTPYDPKRDDARIVQLLDQAIRAVGREARP